MLDRKRKHCLLDIASHHPTTQDEVGHIGPFGVTGDGQNASDTGIAEAVSHPESPQFVFWVPRPAKQFSFIHAAGAQIHLISLVEELYNTRAVTFVHLLDQQLS